MTSLPFLGDSLFIELKSPENFTGNTWSFTYHDTPLSRSPVSLQSQGWEIGCASIFIEGYMPSRLPGFELLFAPINEDDWTSWSIPPLIYNNKNDLAKKFLELLPLDLSGSLHISYTGDTPSERRMSVEVVGDYKFYLPEPFAKLLGLANGIASGSFTCSAAAASVLQCFLMLRSPSAGGKTPGVSSGRSTPQSCECKRELLRGNCSQPGRNSDIGNF